MSLVSASAHLFAASLGEDGAVSSSAAPDALGLGADASVSSSVFAGVAGSASSLAGAMVSSNAALDPTPETGRLSGVTAMVSSNAAAM